MFVERHHLPQIDSTIMMRVNEVIPSTTDGKRVIAVINARICNDSEYDVLPSAPLLEISAGRPVPSPAILLAMLFATSLQYLGPLRAVKNHKKGNSQKKQFG